MKATELMIGDWVYNTRYKCNTRISGIGGLMVWDDRLQASYDEIEPIPLTTEILEKNGLKRDFHGGIYGECFEEDTHYCLEISEDSGKIWWSINYNEYHIIELKYVHELQHALKLCQIEKEIEL